MFAIKDLIVRLLPKTKVFRKYKFAFLVHSRNIGDIYKKYPLSRYLPEFIVNYLAIRMWPVVVSNVEGLKNVRTNKPIDGLVIGFPMTAKQMMEHRERALKKIIQAAKLAEKMGASIIGLGALTSSMSHGGLDLIGKVKAGITTGHAYTAYTVAQYVLKTTGMFRLDRKKMLIAVVGATGSVGSTVSGLLARHGYKKYCLIDVERKTHKFEEVVQNIKKFCPDAQIEISHQIKDTRACKHNNLLLGYNSKMLEMGS